MLRTRNGLPKHCSWNVDRHGTRRVRFRKAGFSTYLTAGPPWSPAFMEAYGLALQGVQAQASTIGASRTIPGSVNALIVSYYRSPEFRGLKASTAAVRRNIIEAFRREHGGKPLARLERNHVKNIIGAKADTPEAANNLLKTLRLLLNYAVDIGMLASNPAIGVKRYKRRGEGFHPWSEPKSRSSRPPTLLHTRTVSARSAVAHGTARGRRQSHGLAAHQRRVDRGATGKNEYPADAQDASGASAHLGGGATQQLDVPSDRARCGVLSRWPFQLVRQGMPRGGPLALHRARPTQARSDPAGQRRREHRDAQGARRAQVIERGRALCPRGGSGAAGRARSRIAVEGRTRTTFVQPGNPTGQTSLKRLSNQWPISEMKTRQGFLPAGLR